MAKQSFQVLNIRTNLDNGLEQHEIPAESLLLKSGHPDPCWETHQPASRAARIFPLLYEPAAGTVRSDLQFTCLNPEKHPA